MARPCVTGAARGVGKGIASALVERGAPVLLVDRDSELLTATVGQLGGPGPRRSGVDR